MTDIDSFFSHLKNVTRPLDSFLKNVGDPILDWAIAQQETAAMANQEYADIAARRTAANAEQTGDSTVLADERFNLSLDDWFRQMEIEREYSQWDDLFTITRFLCGSPATRATNRLLATVQRVIRGWADEDTWNLHYVLTTRLGAQLIHLADNSMSWPGNDEFPEPDEWDAALRLNGEKLLAYPTRDNLDEKLSFEDRVREEERITEDAEDALRWVADHLPHLWD